MEKWTAQLALDGAVDYVYSGRSALLATFSALSAARLPRRRCPQDKFNMGAKRVKGVRIDFFTNPPIHAHFQAKMPETPHQ
jgi:hypothetical protein